MPLQPVYEPSDNGDDLPWLNEYLEELGSYAIELGNAIELKEIVPGPKGMLLLTLSFKAFAFKKSKLFDYLTEYLGKVHGGTIFLYSVGKKVAMAVDADYGDVVLLDLGGRYQQTPITELPSTHPIRVEFETGKPPTPKSRKPRP
jgi:hypothetical protein